MQLLLLVVALFFCACTPKKKPELETPSPEVRDAYYAQVTQTASFHLESNWIVTRGRDGAPKHLGEGLLWTGIWLYAAPCADSEASDAMLRDMIWRHDGGLVRYEPLGEYEGGREITLDGVLGLYRGVADVITRCGLRRKDAWAAAIFKHRAYLKEHGNRFNSEAPARLEGDFEVLLDLLAYRLALTGEAPEAGRFRSLEGSMALWAAAVNASHAAGYRIHLGLLALETLEALGAETHWDAFCASTRGAGIPTVDFRCGRGGLQEWLEGYEPNLYEYRFQRAKWEEPDGNGDYTPGLDLLVAYRDIYNL